MNRRLSSSFLVIAGCFYIFLIVYFFQYLSTVEQNIPANKVKASVGRQSRSERPTNTLSVYTLKSSIGRENRSEGPTHNLSTSTFSPAGRHIQLRGPTSKRIDKTPFAFLFNSSQYPPFWATDVLTHDGIASFEERMSADVDLSARKRLIVSWDVGHDPDNLGGCPDWHCEFSTDQERADEADVILTSSTYYARKRPEQIIAFFSQESPVHTGVGHVSDGYFNVSLGYRHDTAGASPYGYTVKLRDRRQLDKVVNIPRLHSKSKAAAWFVSHCWTVSLREDLVKKLKEYIEVDIYGSCHGGAQCSRNGPCEEMLDTHYHFYMALENSVCTDYITEKAWSQGYTRDIVPIVLKRSIVENRLPPNSFIAIDDFDTVQDLADRMAYLMGNKTAYLEYFSWREEYQTVFLNGATHDVVERPWGFCQLCRLAWEKDNKQRFIQDFNKWWDGSCEGGEVVSKILENSKKTWIS